MCIRDRLIEVVGKNFTGKPHGDAFRSLSEKKGEFDGKADRFLVPAVIGELPLDVYKRQASSSGLARSVPAMA